MGQTLTLEEKIADTKLRFEPNTDGDHYRYEVIGYGSHGFVPTIIFNTWVEETDALSDKEQAQELARRSNNYVHEGPIPVPSADRTRVFTLTSKNTLFELVKLTNPTIFAAYKANPENFVIRESSYARKASPTEIASMTDAPMLSGIIDATTQTINVYGFGRSGNVGINFADRISEVETNPSEESEALARALCLEAAALAPVAHFNIIEWSDVPDEPEQPFGGRNDQMAQFMQMMQGGGENADGEENAPRMQSITQEQFMQMIQMMGGRGGAERPTHDENGVEYPECPGCHRRHAPDN